MECPKCLTNNPDTRKFCRKCGNKLLLICPQCSFENIPGDNFCGECGLDLQKPSETLKELSFDEKIDKIQRFLPQGITEKILSQRGKIEGERKQVTVMFCDLIGFTPLVETLGPEEAYNMMDQIYEILIHKVHEFEGTVNEMTGDGVMALFGAPIALEDAPQRAIKSAMAIHRELTKFNEKQKEQNLPSLKMRIGINTGPVVVGTLGNDLRVEFKAVGDTVNIASRIEALAESGTTYVSADTFNLAAGLFRFESLGEKKIKGKKEPVQIYRVITTSGRRTRFDVSAERGLTTLIGRDRELDLLLDSFERSKKGTGQAISILAEAGVGKSRLLYEFRKRVSNEDITFLEGKCLSYSRNVAYHPLIDILKANFNIQDGDVDSVVKEKVSAGLKALNADEKSSLPYLLEILSVKETGFNITMMSPEAKRERMVEAAKSITILGANFRPLIIAFEDLHWIDNSSEGYLKFLLESISGSRILLIFTYRPEFVHTWGGKSYHSQINLNRLSNKESLSMVYNILGTNQVDKSLEEMILNKTEGIPFFIEEYIKSLRNLNIIQKEKTRFYLADNIQSISIPSTIQDVIMARVDSLPEGAKNVLQAGSAVEREFSYDLIKHVVDTPEKELLSHLSALKDAELVYERGIYPETTYIFKHAFTRDVVYESILDKRKKTLHEKIGCVLVELFGENIVDYYEVIAKHYIESEKYEKAAEYSKLASNKALRSVSLNDVIGFLDQQIFCLEKLRQTEEVQKKIIDARTTLGLFYYQVTNMKKAMEAIDTITELTIKLDYKKGLSKLYTVIGIAKFWFEEDVLAAIANLKKAIAVSEQINDYISLTLSNFQMGNVLLYNSEFEKAAIHYQNAIDLSIAINSSWGETSLKALKSAFLDVYSGQIGISQKNSTEALKYAEQSGDIYSKAFGYVAYGTCLFWKGFLKDAVRYLINGIDLSNKINLSMMELSGHSVIADVYYHLNQYHKSIEHCTKGIIICDKQNFCKSASFDLQIRRTKANILNKQENIDINALLNKIDKITLNIHKIYAIYSIGEILLNIDSRIEESEMWIKKAIELSDSKKLRLFLAMSNVLYAEFFKKNGNITKAKKKYQTAIKIFSECGADGWVEKTEKDLASVK
jgi:class 3 adenylate cyclase/tetratricopeptide (TPR) repeat protein